MITDNDILGKLVKKIAGLPTEMFGTLYDLAEKLGGKEGEERFTALKKFLRKENLESIQKVVSFITCTFMVLVDETQIVEDAVAGKFDWIHDGIISENFPKPKLGRKLEREVSLLGFDRDMSIKAAIIEMDKVSNKPATIWDTLALIVKDPNIQKQFTIVVPGSVCWINDRCRVVCFFKKSGSFGLDLRYLDSVCDRDYRFAGVPK